MKAIVTEKAVMMIESQNVLTFVVSKKMTKTDIKKEIEKIFKVKVEKVRTHVRDNKKYVYAKLNNKNPAIDIATKLGII